MTPAANRIGESAHSFHDKVAGGIYGLNTGMSKLEGEDVLERRNQ